MQKYKLLQDEESNTILIRYGDLGFCPLIQNRFDGSLCVLKITSVREFSHQISILNQVKHKNILTIKDYLQMGQQNFTIIQFVSNNDLFDKIKYNALNKLQIKRVFKGLCEGVAYLHQKGYIHRNLKPSNIVLDQQFNPKIMDFRMAAVNSQRGTTCGHYIYMAPQIMLNQFYNEKVDVWSLGVIFYEMIQGHPPFEGQGVQEIFSAIQKPFILSNKFEKDQIQIIDMMLKANSRYRYPLTTILQHSYFKHKAYSKIVRQHPDNQIRLQNLTGQNLYKNKKNEKQMINEQNGTYCQLFEDKLNAIMDSTDFEQYIYTKDITKLVNTQIERIQ